MRRADRDERQAMWPDERYWTGEWAEAYRHYMSDEMEERWRALMDDPAFNAWLGQFSGRPSPKREGSV